MNARSDRQQWTAVILAGGRGPDDPLARAFSVSHKCLIPAGGVAMLKRVYDCLNAHPAIRRVVISIDAPGVVEEALGHTRMELFETGQSAAESALIVARALEKDAWGPVLLTTADHALLDHEMLDHFLAAAEAGEGDLAVGLARAETILAVYPEAKRTFLPLGRDRVSGCNLYALKTPRALKAVEFWRRLDKDRKKPLRLISAFGWEAVIRFVTRRLSLDSAFDVASRRLGLKAFPVLMPQANAAVDIDKPEDHALVETVLEGRSTR